MKWILAGSFILIGSLATYTYTHLFQFEKANSHFISANYKSRKND